MITYRKFDVDIERAVDVSLLGWPGRGDASHDAGLAGNREYSDLRGFSWAAAQRACDFEDELVDRVENSADAADEIAAIDDELYELEESDLCGLDLGVATLVIALSAARCVPCSSCNAGAYDGAHHQEKYPLVAFYARPAQIPLLGGTGCGGRLWAGKQLLWLGRGLRGRHSGHEDPRSADDRVESPVQCSHAKSKAESQKTCAARHP
jgi:hypothetical protein